MCKQRFRWQIGNSFVVDWLQGSKSACFVEQGALENGLLLLQEWKKIPPCSLHRFFNVQPFLSREDEKRRAAETFLRGPPRKKGERRGENGKGTFPPLPSLIGRKLRHNSRLKSSGRADQLPKELCHPPLLLLPPPPPPRSR